MLSLYLLIFYTVMLLLLCMFLIFLQFHIFIPFRHLWISSHGGCKPSTRVEALSSRWVNPQEASSLHSVINKARSQSHVLNYIHHHFPCFCTPQSVLPFFVATKMTKIRRPTLTVPSAESYVSAELSTVGLQTQTNGYLPHAIMVCAVSAAGEKRPSTRCSGCRKIT